MPRVYARLEVQGNLKKAEPVAPVLSQHYSGNGARDCLHS